MNSGFSIYHIELDNGSEFHVNVRDDFDEYRLSTFLISLELGKIVEIKKVGPCIATIGDALLEPSAHFEHLVRAARQGNLTPKETPCRFLSPENLPVSSALL